MSTSDMNTSTSLLATALSIAATGIPVFPCAADKRPITEKGFHDASRDPEKIQTWFRNPGAKLIGVPTGSVSGIDVLDMDPRHGSDEWRQANIHRLSETRIHGTMNGGEHWVLKHHEGVRNSAGQIAIGVDVRGEGGYVIWPGSPGYKVVSDADIAPWPSWLLDQVLPRPKPEHQPPAPRQRTDQNGNDQWARRYQGRVQSLLDNVRSAPEGAKHDTLLRNARALGGIIGAAGISEAEAHQMLLNALPSTVKDWKNASKTATDGLRHGMAEPLDLEDRPRLNEINNGVGNGSGNGHWNGSANGKYHDPHSQPKGDGQPDPDPTHANADEQVYGQVDDQSWPIITKPEYKKPQIRVAHGDLTRMVDEGEAALIAADLGIYQRSTFIVRPGVVLIEVMDGKNVPGQQILVLGEYGLLEAMTKSASWQKYDGRCKEWVVIDAPIKVVKALRDRVGQWNMPVLSGIIGAPTLRTDGSILSAPGYDRETGLLLDTQGVVFPEVSDKPTKDDAYEALDLLDGLISTFPFVAHTDRSVALSAMLTATIRCSLPTAPLHGFDAPVAGSGKSKLVDLCSILVSGRQAAVIAHGKTEAEFEKRVGSLLLGGERVIAIDNVEEPLGGEFICQVLSQPVVSARILGKSKTPKLPTNVFITANGNNLILMGDITRRAIICTIDPQCERPELRKFDHDPLERMHQRRGEYLVAALTVLRAFHVAGRPRQASPLGSFEVWSKWVRDALLWLGKADPLDTMEAARETDPRRAAIVAVFSQWHTVLGTEKVSVKAVIDRATESYRDEWAYPKFRYPDFREALLVVAGAGGAVNSDRLGKWLRSNKDKVVNGVCIVRAGTTDGSATWQMLP